MKLAGENVCVKEGRGGGDMSCLKEFVIRRPTTIIRQLPINSQKKIFKQNHSLL